VAPAQAPLRIVVPLAGPQCFCWMSPADPHLRLDWVVTGDLVTLITNQFRLPEPTTLGGEVNTSAGWGRGSPPLDGECNPPICRPSPTKK